MKAAPEDQVVLLDLQRLDNDVTRLTHRITALQKGDRLTELGTTAAGLRAELAAATGRVEDAERDLARLESETATAQARIARDTTMPTVNFHRSKCRKPDMIVTILNGIGVRPLVTSTQNQ